MENIRSLGIAAVAAFGLATLVTTTSALAQQTDAEVTPDSATEMSEAITGACADITSVEGIRGCVTEVFSQRDQAIRTIFSDITESNPGARRLQPLVRSTIGQCGPDASRTTRYLTVEEIRQSAAYSMNQCLENTERTLSHMEPMNTVEENLTRQRDVISSLQEVKGCLEDTESTACDLTVTEEPNGVDPLLSLPEEKEVVVDPLLQLP